MFFNMVARNSITKKGAKSVTVRTSGLDNYRDLVVPDGFIVTTQEKAWMDEERMLLWLREI